MSQGDDPENVVFLEEHRIRSEQEFSDEQVAYVEALWGRETWAFNVAIRDLEVMRRGSEDKSLRPPETYHEVEQVVRHIRALANEVSRFYGIEDLVRREDDFGPE